MLQNSVIKFARKLKLDIWYFIVICFAIFLCMCFVQNFITKGHFKIYSYYNNMFIEHKDQIHKEKLKMEANNFRRKDRRNKAPINKTITVSSPTDKKT